MWIEGSYLTPNGPRGGALTASQNSRNFSTRFSGGFPAIKAEFTEPIEMPATQSGCRFASASA